MSTKMHRPCMTNINFNVVLSSSASTLECKLYFVSTIGNQNSLSHYYFCPAAGATPGAGGGGPIPEDNYD